jgi:hypothetical protein
MVPTKLLLTEAGSYSDLGGGLLYQQHAFKANACKDAGWHKSAVALSNVLVYSFS